MYARMKKRWALVLMTEFTMAQCCFKIHVMCELQPVLNEENQCSEKQPRSPHIGNHQKFAI